jgi:hypothetical protein
MSECLIPSSQFFSYNKSNCSKCIVYDENAPYEKVEVSCYADENNTLAICLIILIVAVLLYNDFPLFVIAIVAILIICLYNTPPEHWSKIGCDYDKQCMRYVNSNLPYSRIERKCEPDVTCIHTAQMPENIMIELSYNDRKIRMKSGHLIMNEKKKAVWRKKDGYISTYKGSLQYYLTLRTDAYGQEDLIFTATPITKWEYKYGHLVNFHFTYDKDEEIRGFNIKEIDSFSSPITTEKEKNYTPKCLIFENERPKIVNYDLYDDKRNKWSFSTILPW